MGAKNGIRQFRSDQKVEVDPLDVPRKGVEIHRLFRVVAPLATRDAVVVRVSGIRIQAIDPERVVRLRLKATIEARSPVEFAQLIIANCKVNTPSLRAPRQPFLVSCNQSLLRNTDLLGVIAQILRGLSLPPHQINLSRRGKVHPAQDLFAVLVEDLAPVLVSSLEHKFGVCFLPCLQSSPLYLAQSTLSVHRKTRI